MSKFRARLHYDWILYVLVPVVTIPAWIFSFRTLHQLKPEEKVSMFFAGTIKDYSIKEDSVFFLETSGMLGLEIASCDPTDSIFQDKFELVGLHGSDVVCLPLSIAEKTYCKEAFIEVSSNVYDLYNQEGVNYGFKLAKNHAEKYFDFLDEDYYLFITQTSVYSETSKNNAYNFIDWINNYA